MNMNRTCEAENTNGTIKRIKDDTVHRRIYYVVRDKFMGIFCRIRMNKMIFFVVSVLKIIQD